MITLKTFSLAFISAVLAAVLTIKLVAPDQSHVASDNRSWLDINYFFSRQGKNVQFVEVKNIVITLKNEQGKERYLQLTLGISTNNTANTKKVEHLEPAIRATTINLLSNMRYQDVRALSVDELRQRLISEYKKDLAALNIPTPFNDVVISKMIFQ